MADLLIMVPTVIVRLFAPGIIQRGQMKRPVTDKHSYRALTQAGEDTMLKLRAKRRPEET